MRLKVDLSEHERYTRLIIYVAEKGMCYLFLIVDKDEGYDNWFPTVADAQSAANEQFGVMEHEWIEIPDPLPGTQHDKVEPTVALRGENGHFELVSYDVAIQRGWKPPQ